MSELLRSLIDNRRRGPMGLGNNPAPFQVQQPQQDMMQMLQQNGAMGGMSEERMLRAMQQPDGMQQRYEDGARSLQDYYQKERDPQTQERMRQELEDAARAPNPFIGKGQKIKQAFL